LAPSWERWHRPGDTVDVEYLRRGAKLTAKVKLKERKRR
jgi:hypothetical protein